ncbi:MAG: hypothetical protein MMC33_007544 [Icmadophila ericetorum]|nr:hypothetical protein [Icmadophila ericetorum]
MRYQTIYASLATILLSLSNAQNLGDLPTCAQTPTLTGIASTGCGATDIQCVCKDQSFLNSLLPVLEKACDPSDVAKAVAFAEQLCAESGVTITAPSIPGYTATPTAAGSGSASASAPVSASTPISSAAPGTTGSGSASAGTTATTPGTTAGTTTVASVASVTTSAAATQSSVSSAGSWRLDGGFAAVVGAVGLLAAWV